MIDTTQLDQLCINTMRTLSIDAIEKAQSGHPGTPMGAAPTVYCLWQRFLRYDPDDPNWPNRDRFVLSVGHASMLLYSLLYLCKVKAMNPSYQRSECYAVSLNDIKGFRQRGSRCTGHPEYGWTSGVETTTGPLGQGVATSVGMAIAERWMAATFNRPGYALFDHNVYALCGDGDMMEGMSSEAASIAGHLQLSNLCWIYDDNHITIEGSTNITFNEDVAGRFLSYGWNVVRVSDANDLTLLAAGYKAFLNTSDHPTLIIVESHIGYGAPHKQDTREAHGEPLGTDEARQAKEFYGWDPNAQFHVPDGVIGHFSDHLGSRGATGHAAWKKLFAAYREQFPDLAEQVDCMQGGELPESWDESLSAFPADVKGMATRDASGKVLNAIAEKVPWLLGGAADLAPSTKTHLHFDFAGEFQAPGTEGDYRGRNLHFGIREHAMCAIANGLCLSKLRPYAASFLIFTDYCRGALRLSAMMDLPIIYIWTYDSIAMGEDGPTHQPIEQLASFRAMPGMIVLRPADANETAVAWRIAMETRRHPVALVLTRQIVPTLDRTEYASAEGVRHGAYILADAPQANPDLILIATGSEVSLIIAAKHALEDMKILVRVVSMPSWELFEEQSDEYKKEVFPPGIHARLAVEAGSTLGWHRYVGDKGDVIGVDCFGASAPGSVVMREYGFTVENVYRRALALLGRGLL